MPEMEMTHGHNGFVAGAQFDFLWQGRSRRGEASHGWSRSCRASQGSSAWPGEAWLGGAGQGKAGQVKEFYN